MILVTTRSRPVPGSTSKISSASGSGSRPTRPTTEAPPRRKTTLPPIHPTTRPGPLRRTEISGSMPPPAEAHESLDKVRSKRSRPRLSDRGAGGEAPTRTGFMNSPGPRPSLPSVNRNAPSSAKNRVAISPPSTTASIPFASWRAPRTRKKCDAGSDASPPRLKSGRGSTSQPSGRRASHPPVLATSTPALSHVEKGALRQGSSVGWAHAAAKSAVRRLVPRTVVCPSSAASQRCSHPYRSRTSRAPSSVRSTPNRTSSMGSKAMTSTYGRCMGHL